MDENDITKEIGNMLQRTRADMAKEISAIVEREWMCSLPEILYIIECVSKGNHEPFKEQPAQKMHEPELFICNGRSKDAWDPCAYCWHGQLHKHDDSCKKTPYRISDSKYCCCIPAKQSIPQPSPLPTSGTGTAPEGARTSVSENPCGENCPDCPAPCRIEMRAYPSMAKDIGNLIIRMDNMERSKNIQNAAISKHASQIYDLETALKAMQKEINILKRDTP